MGHKAKLHAAFKATLKMKKCRYCHSRENLTIDHKIPKIKGGKDELKNLQCLCKRCNGIKSGHTDGEIRSLFRWFKQIQIDKENNKIKIEQEKIEENLANKVIDRIFDEL